MKAMINVIRFLLAAVLFALLLFSGWLTLQRAVLHREAPVLLGRSVYSVETDDMGGSLPRGSLALVEKGRSCAPGDALLLRGEDGLTFTRVVGTVSDRFIIQGDAQAGEEQTLLDPEQVEGRVSGRISDPFITAFFRFLSQPVSMAVLLAAGIVILLLPRLAVPSGKNGGRHSRD